jgi:hypothetical protein
MPEVGLVMLFIPLTTAAAAETGVQSVDGARFVVDWRVNPVALVGQVKITFGAAGVMLSFGEGAGKEILKSVPFPQAPP